MHKPGRRVFPRYFEFSQTSTTVTTPRGDWGGLIMQFSHRLIIQFVQIRGEIFEWDFNLLIIRAAADISKLSFVILGKSKDKWNKGIKSLLIFLTVSYNEKYYGILRILPSY